MFCPSFTIPAGIAKRNVKRRSTAAALTAIFSIVVSQVQADQLVRVKLDKRAANGVCLPQIAEKSDQVLKRNQISISRTDDGSVGETVKTALARIVFVIENIGQGKFEQHKNVSFIFESKWGYSYYVVGTNKIHIRPGTENYSSVKDKRYGGTNNFAMLAHELSHYISLRDDKNIQKAYEDYASDACNFTRYTHANRHEEFAEVFAAFLTSPDLLQNQGASCEKARRFFSNMFKEDSKHSHNCESRQQSLIQR